MSNRVKKYKDTAILSGAATPIISFGDLRFSHLRVHNQKANDLILTIGGQDMVIEANDNFILPFDCTGDVSARTEGGDSDSGKLLVQLTLG